MNARALTLTLSGLLVLAMAPDAVARKSTLLAKLIILLIGDGMNIEHAIADQILTEVKAALVIGVGNPGPTGTNGFSYLSEDIYNEVKELARRACAPASRPSRCLNCSQASV